MFPECSPNVPRMFPAGGVAGRGHILHQQELGQGDGQKARQAFDRAALFVARAAASGDTLDESGRY
eukprot:392747-Prorocentrum_minimum.AAC.1